MARNKTSFPFIILLFLFSFYSCSKPHHIKSDDEQEREMVLKHHFKTINEYKTIFLLGMKQSEQLSQQKFFNEKGFKTKEVEYRNDGAVDASLKYQYDGDGNLICINAITKDSSFLFKETQSFDENKNRKELYYYLPDGTYKYRNAATYDKAGRMIELRWYWPDGLKAINRFQYISDKKTEDAEYDPQNKLTYRWQYNYDVKGNLVEAIQFSPINSINRKIIYEYNPQNQLIKQSTYSGEQLQGITTFQYNEKNLRTSKSEYSASGRLSAIFRYEYL